MFFSRRWKLSNILFEKSILLSPLLCFSVTVVEFPTWLVCDSFHMHHSVIKYGYVDRSPRGLREGLL